MKTVDVEATNPRPEGSNGKSTPRPEGSNRTRAKQVAQEIKSRPDILAGRVILTGAGVVVGLVIAANVVPYSRLANNAIRKTLGINLPWLGRLIGICGLASITVGEAYPYTMHRPTAQAYAASGAIALLSYGIDSAIAIWAWPPLKVGIGEFVAVPMMSSINWSNCLVILILLFGVEAFIKLWQTVGKSNRSQD